MHANNRIIIGALLLIAAGMYQALVINKSGTQSGTPVYNRTLTRVAVGGYLVAILASVVDMVSPEFGWLAGSIIMLGVLTAVLTILPDLAGRVISHNQAS